jgi:cytochrome c oxidase accessory protein FixG
VCFWLCPYARIQGVMLDRTTIVPTYDEKRGEPRGRVVKGKQAQVRTTGDCVDCNQCVAVCPTGIDIRNGQQEGCITCGLCLDACDAVMEKVGRPTGLIRYASLDEFEGKPVKPMLKRPRVWVYSGILLLAWIGIIFGMSTMSAIEMKVLHERAPLFSQLSDGSIQNKFTLKLLNKSPEDLEMRITATGPKGLELIGADDLILTKHGEVMPVPVFVKVASQNLAGEREPVIFVVEGRRTTGAAVRAERESVFFGPKR